MLRKRITKSVAEDLLEKFLHYYIPLLEVDFRQVFFLALEKNLTVYDASYVALAKHHHIPLLTLDEELKKIASK